MIEIIEAIGTIFKSFHPLVWIGFGLFIGAIAYVIWLWKQRF